MSNEKSGLILMIETDAPQAALAEAAVKSIGDKLVLKTFASEAELAAWLAAPAKPEEPDATPANVRLVLRPTETLKDPAAVALWRDDLGKAGVAADAPIVLTTFDHAETVPGRWAGSGAFNLIVKPYDPLLLQQHLRLALGAKDAPSAEGSVHVMKVDSMIESLKAVPMTGLSEVGLVTRSEMELPLGRVTKFYALAFAWNDLKSVYARTHSQEQDPATKAWRVKLTWFGTGRDQLLQIRGRFPSKEKEIKLEWTKPGAGGPTKFLVIGDPSMPGSELAGTLERNFTDIEVRPSADIPDPKAALPSPLTAIFIHKAFLERLGGDARFKDVPRIGLSEKILTDEELRDLKSKTVDVITLPTERVAFFKRMAVLFPALKPSEERPVKTYEWTDQINVGQPVEITEMSEGGLVEKYERPLAVGTIRRFVLWFPSEMQLPVLTARCYQTAPDPGKPGAHLNRFVFFGMSDRETKHVRIWMRDNYIKAKQKG